MKEFCIVGSLFVGTMCLKYLIRCYFFLTNYTRLKVYVWFRLFLEDSRGTLNHVIMCDREVTYCAPFRVTDCAPGGA